MKDIRSHYQQKRSAGFTIVELLVATLVFSLVLLILTTGILQISSVFLKGVTNSNAQSVATNTLNTIAQAIQFNNGTVTTTPASVTAGNSYVFCVGPQRFSYRPGYQLIASGTRGTDQTYYSLIEDTPNGGCTGTTPALNLSKNMNSFASGRELLSPLMRLSSLSVALKSSTGGAFVYEVSIKVVYGDNVLLHNPTAATANCIGNSGEQFCSVSQLSTIVVKRVQ